MNELINDISNCTMGSSRLPEKVMINIMVCLISNFSNRLSKSKYIDKIVVTGRSQKYDLLNL